MEWRRRVGLMAVVSAIGVAIVYLPQPMQTLQADEFGIDNATSALTQVLGQLGYAIGILFLLPAADSGSTRRQVTVQLVATAVALALAAAAPTFAVLCMATFVAGAATTVAPVLIADAVRLAPPEVRGRSTAVLGGAFLIGIFTTRSLAGSAADLLGWRPVLLGAAVLALACIPLVRRAVERSAPVPGFRYAAALRSIPRLALTTPALVLNTCVQVCTFGAFIAAWSAFTVHAVHGRLGLSVLQAALVGLVGLAAGAGAIALARLVDRAGTRRTLITAIALEAAGLAALAIAPDLLGVVLPALFAVSLGAIVAQIATQARGLPAAGPGTAARANTVYMVIAFGASALWVAVATGALGLGGYPLVAVVGLALCAGAATLWAVGRRRDLV